MRVTSALRGARRRARLTQRALAERAGVPQSTIGRIESGAITPRADTLLHLLNACGADLEVVDRLGIGIDRGQIQERLALTPRQRLDDLVRAAHAIRQLRGKALQDP
jgi:transcriptional regulator with XRE-family HTH domain